MNVPVAESGVIDLRKWDFTSDGNIKLDGEWQFFWQKTQKAVYADNAKLSRYTVLPGPWKKNKDNSEVLSKGYASYRLRVLLPADAYQLGFIIEGFSSAYKIWINGQLFSSNGKTGTNVENEIPQWLPLTAYYTANKSTLDIVLEISNFHYHKGGPWRSIWLGEMYSIQRTTMINVALECFLAGSLLIIGLYHLGLYFLRRKDRTTLYFALFCLFVFLRSGVENERILIRLFPNFDWEIQMKIIFLSIHLGIFYFASFLLHFFPNEYSSRFVKILKNYIYLIGAIILVTPARLYSPLIIIFRLVVIFFLIHTMYSILKAVRNHRQSAKTILLGFLLLLVTIINDILYSMDIIYSAHLITFGLFLFIFEKSYILSIRFTGALNTNERISKSLEKKNLELKRINKQKDEYLSQVKIANERLIKILNITREMALAREKKENIESVGRVLRASFSNKYNLQIIYYGFLSPEEGNILAEIPFYPLAEAPDEIKNINEYVFGENKFFIPISFKEKKIESILVITIIDDSLKETDKSFIEMLIESLILSIKNIDYTKEMQEKVRMEMELKTASGVQSTIIPQKMPDIENLEIRFMYKPASETGGDWYYMYQFNEDIIYFFIGDVTGHGVSSALVAASVYGCVKTYMDFFKKLSPPNPSMINLIVNQLIYDIGKLYYYMTFISIRLNLKTGELLYCNSAHNRPIIYSKNSHYIFPETGLILGTPFEFIAKDEQIQLKDNDLLFLYTDGVIEAENSEKEFFGEANIMELLQYGYSHDIDSIIESISENVEKFVSGKPLADDLTMVAIRYRERDKK